MLSTLLAWAALQIAAAAAVREPAPAVEGAALEAVFAEPRPWLGRRVRATFQLEALPETWNPFLTRFGTRDWVAAAVWGDGQFLWREEQHARPLGLVFARRGGPIAERLAAAETYQRFTAELEVRELFLGLPWAEVVALAPEELFVGEGAILHASRALKLIASGDWQLAREDLLRASAAPLPAHARAELERLRSLCDAGIAERARRMIAPRRLR
jgi:hypothetical protein